MKILCILKGMSKGRPDDSKPLEQCMYYMKINDLGRFTETLELIQNWSELRGTIPIQIYKNEPGLGTLVNIKCTLLQMAVVLQNVNAIKLLTHESRIRPDELQTYLDEKVSVQVSHLESDAEWIQGASVAHLAARFCPQALGLLLDIKPDLKDNFDNEAGAFPLHVAAGSPMHKCTSIRILLRKGATIDAKDHANQTSLHIAAKYGNFEGVVALVLDGEADIYETDQTNRRTPLHVAKTSEVFEFLLTKTNMQKLRKIDPNLELFNIALKQNPHSFLKFLDTLVTSTDNDLLRDENQFVYDLSLFTNGTKKEICHMDRHFQVIEDGHPEFLLHPLMQLFVDIKWRQNTWQFISNFTIFTIFLGLFMSFGFNHIDYIQCLNILDQNPNLPGDLEQKQTDWINKNCYETNYHSIVCVTENGQNEYGLSGDKLKEFKYTHCSDLQCEGSTWKLAETSNEHAKLWNTIKNCNQKISPDDPHLEFMDIHKYTTWAFLSILILVEVFQICGKLITGRICTYFSRQNFIDILILVLTCLYFYFIEINDYVASGHVGGWALFLAWMNFTFFLGKIPMFGKSIFISMNVATSICKVFVVYIPSLFAFTSAFHFFMYGDPIFRSYTDGILKVVVMMIGEFDFEDHFEWYKVRELGGRQFSVQVNSQL